MNKAMLRSKMALNGDTGGDLAEYLGISQVTFSRKINETDGAEFSQNEVSMIKARYDLTPDELVDIFFNKELS